VGYVVPGEGMIQDATCGAGEGIRFMCMRGRMPGNVDVNKRITLIGDDADVCGC